MHYYLNASRYQPVVLCLSDEDEQKQQQGLHGWKRWYIKVR